jgi:hypothetical protein
VTASQLNEPACHSARPLDGLLPPQSPDLHFTPPGNLRTIEVGTRVEVNLGHLPFYANMVSHWTSDHFTPSVCQSARADRPRHPAPSREKSPSLASSRLKTPDNRSFSQLSEWSFACVLHDFPRPGVRLPLLSSLIHCPFSSYCRSSGKRHG